MMTSSNGNIFRVIGPLCGEFTGPGEFPTQRPVTRSFDVYFDLRLNKRLSKQPWGWWFETLSWSLCRHCNVMSVTTKLLNVRRIFTCRGVEILPEAPKGCAGTERSGGVYKTASTCVFLSFPGYCIIPDLYQHRKICRWEDETTNENEHTQQSCLVQHWTKQHPLLSGKLTGDRPYGISRSLIV